MGESVYGLTVRDVLLEANLRLGGEKSFNLGDGSPHLQWQRIAFGERHCTAVQAYGFANQRSRHRYPKFCGVNCDVNAIRPLERTLGEPGQARMRRL
jgi:hypothetical protein